MSRKKIDRIEKGLKVIDINAKGMGVAKNDEGVVYFIKDVIPGDVIDVQVYKKGEGILKRNPFNGLQNPRTVRHLLVTILEFVVDVNCNTYPTKANWNIKRKVYFII